LCEKFDDIGIVQLKDTGEIVNCHRTFLIPIKPDKKDQVVVIRGECKGQIGTLMGWTEMTEL